MNTKAHVAPAELARMSAAWDWVHRLRQESPSQDELNQWLQWYESDERNKHAFDRARSLSQQAHRVAEGPHALPSKLWRDPPPTPARRWRHTRRPALWASLALAAGLGAVTFQALLRVESVTDKPIESLVITADNTAQPVKETWLPDGSRVDLASRSSVNLEYSEKTRLVNLKSGVAYFTVAHNRERPFIVHAGDFYVRAVGTAFNVRRAGSRMVVTVTDGTVDVYPATAGHDVAAAAPIDALRVKAGKEVIWESPNSAPSVAAADPRHALSWREGRLEYLNEPLSAAVADINRYSSSRVIIGDPAVGKLEFSGAVQTDATDAWIRAVPKLLPVDLRTGDDGSVVLVSRGNG